MFYAFHIYTCLHLGVTELEIAQLDGAWRIHNLPKLNIGALVAGKEGERGLAHCDVLREISITRNIFGQGCLTNRRGLSWTLM